mgnify:CR=1 FL=1
MKVQRRGEDSYYALLDAGVSWFEAFCSVEFLLDSDNVFSLIITPLNGRDIKQAEVTLDGLPDRDGAPSRLYMEIKMPDKDCIRIEALGSCIRQAAGNG